MNKLVKTALVVFATCVACGSSSEFELTAKPPHAMQPKNPAEVKVVQAPAHAEGVEVGHLEVESGTHVSGDAQTDEVMQLAVKSAAEHGCDAIETEPADVHLAATSNGTPLHRTTLRARCFVTP